MKPPKPVDELLLVALSLWFGAALAQAPLATACAAAAIAFLLRKHARPALLGFCLVCLAIGGLRARNTLETGKAAYDFTAEFLHPPARCEAVAVVIASPVVIRKNGEPIPDQAESDLSGRADMELLSGQCGDRPIQTPFRARLYGAPSSLRRGDRAEIIADLSPVHLFLNEGLRDPRPSIARLGITASGGLIDLRIIERPWSIGALVDEARARVRRRIEATYHPEAAPLARALVLGETNLDPLDDEAFRVSGLSHLLAVSGTHLVIAVAGFAAALRAVLVRIQRLSARMDVGRAAAAVSIPAAFLYADFAGGSGSAVRAAGMLGAAMLAQALGRKPSGVRSLAWSLLVPSLWDPLVLCDMSFALSAGATAGLLALSRPLGKAFEVGPALFRPVLSAIATTLAAMAGCTAIVAMASPTLPLAGILANILAAPVGELAALPICLLHTVLAWAPSLEQGTALLGSGALLIVRAIARFTAERGPTLAVPPPSAAQLSALAIFACMAFVASSRRARISALLCGAAALLLLEAWALRQGSPKNMLRVHLLDIGQGDSIFVELPNGAGMLVDAGGFVGSPIDTGSRVIQPFLRYKRRKHIDIAVLSHPHPDHFGGLPSALSGVSVGEFWDTGQGEEHGAGPVYASLLRSLRQQNVPIRRPAELCGRPREIGGAVVDVLAPCPAIHQDRSANDNSFVIRVSYGRRAALLVGDSEHEAEAELLERAPSKLRADLLKVGHHGSRTSTSPAFLEAVSPSFAGISCGVRNRFGHPHPMAMSTLSRFGIPILRTDRGGHIVWESDGDTMHVRRGADL